MGKQQKLKKERRIAEAREGIRTHKRKRGVILVIVIGLLLIAGIFGFSIYQSKNTASMSNESSAAETATTRATIATAKGNIVVELYPADAPKTIDNFEKLAKNGLYAGTTFHRVVPGFVIQGGDPNSKDNDPSNDGQGGPGYQFEDEINPWSLGLPEADIQELEAMGYKYRRDLASHTMDVGALAMANSGPATNGSQFFIVTDEAQPHLDGRHTVFGKVVEGMDVVRAIAQGDVMQGIQIGN